MITVGLPSGLKRTAAASSTSAHNYSAAAQAPIKCKNRETGEPEWRGSYDAANALIRFKFSALYAVVSDMQHAAAQKGPLAFAARLEQLPQGAAKQRHAQHAHKQQEQRCHVGYLSKRQRFRRCSSARPPPAPARAAAASPSPDLHVDVCILGAGVIGVWTTLALLRSEPDLRVALVDARQPCAGATGAGQVGAGPYDGCCSSFGWLPGCCAPAAPTAKCICVLVPIASEVFRCRPGRAGLYLDGAS